LHIPQNSQRKTKLPEKSEPPDKRGFKLTEKRIKKKRIPAPPAKSLYKLSMTPMVCNISNGYPDQLSLYAPSQLLHACSLAEYEKLEKSP